jgi:chromosome segregation ATPase
METSDWIAIYSMVASILIATIGSALYASFRIGGSNEKLMSITISIDKLENTMERNTKELREDTKELREDTKELRDDVSELRADVGEIRIEMTEIRVKVDELWRDHIDSRR